MSTLFSFHTRLQKSKDGKAAETHLSIETFKRIVNNVSPMPRRPPLGKKKKEISVTLTLLGYFPTPSGISFLLSLGSKIILIIPACNAVLFFQDKKSHLIFWLQWTRKESFDGCAIQKVLFKGLL